MMNKYKCLLIMSILILSILSSCNNRRICFEPEGEIAFMPDRFIVDESIAFADTKLSSINIYSIKDTFIMPVWSLNGRFLYGLTTYSGGAFIGYPAYWDLEKGRYKRCDKNLPYYFQIQGIGNPDNPKEVMLTNVNEIIIMDLETCQIRQTLVDEDSYPDYFMILGISYCPKKRTVAYGLYYDYEEGWRYEIILHNVDSGEEEVIGLGVNPSWSHDGERIAYFDADGRLYMMDADGSNNRKLITCQFFESHGKINAGIWPFVRWSPDDKWLIYHRCDDFKLSPKYCQIFRLNIQTGEEEMIIDQGMYPDWNPSGSE